MNKKHILLVEDDEVFSDVMTRALLHRNYDASHAANEDEALLLIKSTQFDYAILDLNLGSHTSLDLIAPLKNSSPSIRILILTGYASITTAVEAIKLGADNYLAKPADANEILGALLGTNQPNTVAGRDPAQLEPMSVRRLEWEYIQKVLNEHDGNISETARRLKMHRRTLQRKLQKRPMVK